MAVLDIKKFVSSETYKVKIHCPGLETINGFLVSPIMITTQSSWQSRANQAFAGGAMDKGTQAVTGGQSLTNTAFTVQAWQGSEPLSINVTVGFVGITDAWREVMKPSKILMMMPLSPESTGGFLKAPVAVEPMGGGDLCTVFTSYLNITDLVPCSATPEYSQTLTKNHSGGGHSYPVSANVTMQFQSSKSLTRSEVDAWFR